MKSVILQFFILLIMGNSFIYSQDNNLSIVERHKKHKSDLARLEKTDLLSLHRDRSPRNFQLDNEIKTGLFYKVDAKSISELIATKPDLLVLEIFLDSDTKVRLELTKAKVFTDEFKLYLASDRENPITYDPGAHYWGQVNGQANTLAALSITDDEVMGIFQYNDQSYTLGKLNNAPDFHVVYKNEDLMLDLNFTCETDADEHYRGDKATQSQDRNNDPTKCVKMYVEVDHDIFVGKGGTTQAANYVSGAFSQVAILYANENINFVVNEMVVWNIQDPYTGPSTSNYLTQFRNALGTGYNGDLAHLVGYNGGGGVAYLDVVCNRSFGFGYSAINSTYANVPTYSWTVMVLAHEIGHNLGSPHTHDCRWNGNNTPIDCCGQNAGYAGSGCASGYNCTIPDPSAGGTIMSYCHLRSVRINLNLGFGLQPGNLMRNRVHNASCLTSCGPPILNDAGISAILQPIDFPCESNVNPVVILENFGSATLSSVTIQYQLDNGGFNNFNWTGNLPSGATVQVVLPQINYTAGNHIFTVKTTNPNGSQDETPGNDQSSVNFTYIPDYCVCNEATESFPSTTLNHSGSGNSQISIAFAPGSKNVVFTVSGLDSRTNGNQNNRYIEEVTITYINAQGVNTTYGVFGGNIQNSVNVNIQDFVNSITVRLRNGITNNFNGTLSVSLSTVSYCSPVAGCNDADDDGICDEDDICPGFDDNLIGTSCDDGNPCTFDDIYTTGCVCIGTLDPTCGEEDCTTGNSNFSANPLTQSGSTPSVSTTTLPAGSYDVQFSITNLDARLNGNANRRYIERVTITYVNGNGQTINYGAFRGDQVNNVNVNISGAVQSVSVALDDVFDGNSSPSVLSVSLSSVSYCMGSGALINPEDNNTNTLRATLYPNPANGEFTIELSQVANHCNIFITNNIGQILGQYQFTNQRLMRMNLVELGIHSQLLFVIIKADDHPDIVRPILIID